MGIIQFPSTERNTRLKPPILNMNKFIVIALALASVEATPLFFAAPAAFSPLAISSTLTTAEAAALAASNVAGAEAVATATSAIAATNLLVGVGLLKAVVIGGLALHHASRNRGKRSVEENETFAILAGAPNAQCTQRLICDLAAGAIEDKDNLLSLFNEEASPVSHKFEFTSAAKVGKIVKKAQLCEIRYSCPLSTLEIQQILLKA